MQAIGVVVDRFRSSCVNSFVPSPAAVRVQGVDRREVEHVVQALDAFGRNAFRRKILENETARERHIQQVRRFLVAGGGQGCHRDGGRGNRIVGAVLLALRVVELQRDVRPAPVVPQLTLARSCIAPQRRRSSLFTYPFRSRADTVSEKDRPSQADRPRPWPRPHSCPGNRPGYGPCLPSRCRASWLRCG